MTRPSFSSPDSDDAGRKSMSLRTLFDWRRWRLVPRQSLFLLSALPLALFVPVTVVFLASVGAGLLVLGIGIVLLVAAAMVSRWFGELELRRLVWAGCAPIQSPQWPEVKGKGWLARAWTILTDPRQWSFVAHTILYLPLGTLSGSLILIWIAGIIGGATRWIWNDGVTDTSDQFARLGWLSPQGWLSPDLLAGPLPIVANLVFGVFALLTLPWLTGAMVGLHDRQARVFLSRYAPDELDAQMQELDRSRRAGVTAEGRTLRKFERDLHDGPQQQLLRLQLDLAEASRKMASDPDTASLIIKEAARRSAETLSELRSLVQGIAPPILQDRGLAAALQALAERNPIPTAVSTKIDPKLDIEPAVQQGIYFMVSELLANTVKHSQATAVTITCTVETDASKLRVMVGDNGVGGADVLSGRGLSGIDERVGGLGGSWLIKSPRGGPTMITLNVPV